MKHPEAAHALKHPLIVRGKPNPHNSGVNLLDFRRFVPTQSSRRGPCNVVPENRRSETFISKPRPIMIVMTEEPP